MAPRYAHGDLVRLVREALEAALERPPGALTELIVAPLTGVHIGCGRREVLRLAELLEEDLGIILLPGDLVRLMAPSATIASAARLCAEVLVRQDIAHPPPAPAPVAILGVQRHGA